jgi:hypothetical protein
LSCRRFAIPSNRSWSISWPSGVRNHSRWLVWLMTCARWRSSRPPLSGISSRASPDARKIADRSELVNRSLKLSIKRVRSSVMNRPDSCLSRGGKFFIAFLRKGLKEHHLQRRSRHPSRAGAPSPALSDDWRSRRTTRLRQPDSALSSRCLRGGDPSGEIQRRPLHGRPRAITGNWAAIETQRKHCRVERIMARSCCIRRGVAGRAGAETG